MDETGDRRIAQAPEEAGGQGRGMNSPPDEFKRTKPKLKEIEMSAFIVSNEHINTMLQAKAPRYAGDCTSYYWDGEHHYFGGHHQVVGQKLVDENYRSVNYRYSENETGEFKSLPVRTLTPVEIIKACDCYSYQSCETPDWEQTEAYAIMTALRERAIGQLPGYDKAAWSI